MPRTEWALKGVAAAVTSIGKCATFGDTLLPFPKAALEHGDSLIPFVPPEPSEASAVAQTHLWTLDAYRAGLFCYAFSPPLYHQPEPQDTANFGLS